MINVPLLVRENKWIHTVLGLIGNALFLIGSVFFFRESTIYAGTWLFVLGAAGMLIGSIGDAIVMHLEDQSAKQQPIQEL